MPKRKPDRSGDHAANKQPTPICIIHVFSITDHGHFTPLSEIKGTADAKLQQLHQIRDRHMCLAHDSPYSRHAKCTK